MFAPRSRQNPGAACEECRRRKLRCDRQLPQCGLCETSGVTCKVDSVRAPRGPKRGYLRELQDRVAALEGSLFQEQSNKGIPTHNDESAIEKLVSDAFPSNMDWNFPVFGEDTTLTESTPVRSTANAGDLRVEPTNLDKSPNITNIIPPSGFQALPDMTAPMSSGQCSSSSTSIEEPELAISEFMEADLDQLYFDRIHTFIPILHQRRYFSWRRQPGKSDSQICLQYVIWTMAASVSAHHQSLGGGLYGCARRRLAQLDSKDIEPGSNPVEEAQAWLLIAIHELMGVDFRRGWISAGRAFRLMQINWFHEPDIIDGVPLPADWVELEQKRITFWMGYCFDRFISAQTGSLFTFNEQIPIRLPPPDHNYQNDQPTLTGFLSEAMRACNPSAMPLLTECIIVATFSGRILAHRYQSQIDIYFKSTQDFWERHQWIDSMLQQRMESFAVKYPPAAQQADPILLFISMMWHANVLGMHQAIQRVVPLADERSAVMMEQTKRAHNAARDIVALGKNLAHLNLLKVHPLNPIPLKICADWLAANPSNDASVSESLIMQLHDITMMMPNLKRFVNPGQGSGNASR